MNKDLPKLLRAIASGSQAIENKHDIILIAAAEEIERLRKDLEPKALCCVCNVDCSNHFFMCDQVDKFWCPKHFADEVCLIPHGEGCMTQVHSTRDPDGIGK
jgi:hypothetical protein